MFSNQMRMTGFSGIDVADMVNQMMRAESSRLHRLQQQRQIFSWQQEQLRGVANSIMTFRNRNTDILAPAATNIRNAANFTGVAASINGGNGTNSGLSVTTNSQATAGNHTLFVQQIAQNDVFRSAAQNSSATTSSIDMSQFLSLDNDGQLVAGGGTMSVTVNGATRNINIDSSIMSGFVNSLGGGSDPDLGNDLITALENGGIDEALNNRLNEAFFTNEGDVSVTNNGTTTTTQVTFAEQLVNSINTQLLNQFGSNPNVAGMDGMGLQRVTATIEPITGGGFSLNLNASASNQVVVNNDGGPLGFAGSSGAPINLNQTVEEFFGTNAADRTLVINGTTIDLQDPELTLREMMTRVNNANLGVRMSFSEVSGRFTLEGLQTGADNAISISGTAAGQLGFERTQEAQDAIFVVNGTTVSQASNTISAYGMNITATQQAVGQTHVIRLEANTAGVREMVTNFVDQYNALVRELQELSSTTRPRDNRNQLFQPLTDEQRRAMSESEIADWERNAQTGLLNRDSQLRGILQDMRNEMSRVITLENGGTFSLAQMGITLDMRNPAAGGMLVIDPTQFDAALENNIEGITALFTGQGASGMATHSQNGAPRIGDSPGGDLILGLGARLDHVLNRHAGHGGLGALAARAGVEGRETDNTLGRQIQDQDRRIDNMMRWLERRENQLFAQFSRMELAMMQGQQQMMFWDQIMWGAM